MSKDFLAKKKEINTLKTDVNALKATDERIWTNLDTINKTASAAKIKAEEGVAKADDALTATRTNATNINSLTTDVNALKATDERIWTNLDTINKTASTAKIKAEEGVAKADSALARNIFTDEEKAKLANITNPMVIKGRVDTVNDLPTEAVIGWFYFVGLESASSYEEYCYSENGWEYIGLSQEGVDLSNYYTKKQVDTTINELKAVDNSLGTRIDNVDSKASAAKIKAEEGVVKADDALTKASSNTTNINSLQTDVNSLRTDVNALKATDERIWTNLDTINKTASAAKIKAEEGVAKADDALAATRTNATNITNLQTDVTDLINEKNIMGSRLTTAENNINNINSTVAEIKTLAETTESNVDKLNISAGSVTKPIYLENGTPKECSYTLGEASSRGVDTTPTNLSNNLITSGAVYEAVTELDEKTDSTNTVVGDLAENLQGTYNKINSLKSDIALNRTTLGTQCKNLLKTIPKTITSGGVTCVIDDDGIVTVNGTASETIFIDIMSNISLDETLEYTLTGTYDNSSYGYIYYQFGDTTDGTKRYNDSGNGVTFKGTRGSIFLRIPVGRILNNVKYYPMLRYADITDSTYEPYKESVDERLIENKSDIAINKTTLGYQCKNLLKPTNSITRAGITYTVNEDGSVTLAGTSTTGSTYNYFSIPVTLKPGKYKVNGMPSTSSNSTYRVDLRANASGGTAYGYGAKEFEVEFTETTTVYYMIRIDGSYKEPLKGITFYPMIRYADILDDTYEPYQPSLLERCLLKDTAGIALGAASGSSITIDNLSSYTALWINVAGAVAGINFKTNLIVPIAYLAKSTSNRVQLAGGIPSSAYITSEGVLAAKDMNGTIVAKVSGNTLDLTIGTGTIGSVEVISLM